MYSFFLLFLFCFANQLNTVTIVITKSVKRCGPVSHQLQNNLIARCGPVSLKLHATGAIQMKWKCPKCGREFSRQNQDHYCIKPQTIDEYISAQDEKVQPKLQEIRAILKAALPQAEERISWSMPTYWKGRNIIHFAASKKHLGLYPGDEATAEFADKLTHYSVSKGTIRLPYDEELPAGLLTEIAVWCFNKHAK